MGRGGREGRLRNCPSCVSTRVLPPPWQEEEEEEEEALTTTTKEEGRWH